jgi:enamine deaminase RidA (YjgF/YER057c/UK114 family)
MATDCSTAPPAAGPAAAAPRVAARLRVGVRHAATSLCLRIACLNTAATTPATQDLEYGMAQVMAAADRLLREAGSHRHRILSCELFVREPNHTADARRMLCGWMAGGLARQQVAPPAVHAHPLVRPLPGTAGQVAAPLVEIALVVAHRAGAGSAL